MSPNSCGTGRDFFMWNDWIMLDRLKTNNINRKEAKMKKEYVKKDEVITEVSLERARELLGNETISDAELIKLMDNLRGFCRIIVDIESSQKRDEQTNDQNEKYSSK